MHKLSMGFDEKLIKCVKEYPVIYQNKGTVEERDEAWSKIAEKLEKNEQVVKVRWYNLKRRYRQSTKFPYVKELEFARAYIGTSHNDVDNGPEFVITEEDLKDKRLAEKTEFHYLSKEQEQTNESNVSTQKDSGKNLTVNPNNDSNAVERITDTPASNASNAVERITDTPASNDSNAVEAINDTTAREKDDEQKTSPNKKQSEKDNDKHEESSECQTTTNAKTQKENSNIQRESIQPSAVVESPESPKRKSKSLPRNERCEDDIFGELISAMLKPMEESKKKSIKKEIMNILFS